MAEILTVGISHYPPLHGVDQNMANILKHMLQNPNLPEKLRTPAGWPEGMRVEWGNDEGAAAAKHHREQLVAGMRKVRAAIDKFRPDFILIWGDDQYENFKEDIIPPFCISAHAAFEFGVPPNNVWGEASDKKYQLTGSVPAAKYLTTKLIERGFEIPYSYKPLHHPLGHAFTNAILYLDYDRTGFPYPIVPFAINCYGRHVVAQRGGRPVFEKPLPAEDLDPPAPTPRRLFDLGGETARILADSPWRVALLASSGWSHAFLVEKNHYLYPDTTADRRLYEALKLGDYKTWRDYPYSAIEESGQQEVLNWHCLVGALDALKRTPAETSFVDTWIFNSSKCFLVSKPE
jgi:hypothetical protein